MRGARILYKEEEAGILKQHDDGTFSFQYHKNWLENDSKPGYTTILSILSEGSFFMD
jgi:HipA-like protein